MRTYAEELNGWLASMESKHPMKIGRDGPTVQSIVRARVRWLQNELASLTRLGLVDSPGYDAAESILRLLQSTYSRRLR